MIPWGINKSLRRGDDLKARASAERSSAGAVALLPGSGHPDIGTGWGPRPWTRCPTVRGSEASIHPGGRAGADREVPGEGRTASARSCQAGRRKTRSEATRGGGNAPREDSQWEARDRKAGRRSPDFAPRLEGSPREDSVQRPLKDRAPRTRETPEVKAVGQHRQIGPQRAELSACRRHLVRALDRSSGGPPSAPSDWPADEPSDTGPGEASLTGERRRRTHRPNSADHPAPTAHTKGALRVDRCAVGTLLALVPRGTSERVLSGSADRSLRAPADRRDGARNTRDSKTSNAEVSRTPRLTDGGATSSGGGAGSTGDRPRANAHGLPPGVLGHPARLSLRGNGGQQTRLATRCARECRRFR